MKLTIEATDPIEIATLAGFLAGVKPSSGFDEYKASIPTIEECKEPSPPTEVAQTATKQTATKQGAGKRGRPKKLTELSSVTATSDASADYETHTIVSPADAGVEYEMPNDQTPTIEEVRDATIEEVRDALLPTDPIVVPTIEEVRSTLIKLSDAKGVSVATGLIAEYAESRKAQDVPEDKRAELIAKAEKLKAE